MERKHSPASTPKTIAIIGGGFSGTMVAVHLLRRATYPLSIKLVERRPEVGQGIAYSTPMDSHLLNVPAAKMSAFPDEPDHFLRWLKHHAQSNEDKKDSDTATRFMPRRLYRDYIQSVFREAVVNAAPMVHLERITAEAIALKPSGEEAMVFLDTGDSLYADRVVLALGNFASSVPAPLKDLTDRPQSRSYVREAWSGEATRNLPIDAPVLLVGTGLTMADMVVTLRENGHQGQIYAVSRHGLLPQCHLSPDQAQSDYPPFLEADITPRSIRALLRRVRQEVQTAVEQEQDWRSVIDALRPITQELWQNLPLIEQKRFLRHVKSYWEVHRHRIAQEIAAVLDQAMECNQLIDYAGRIQTCQDLGDRVAVTIRHRGTDQQTVLHVERIINCTGATGHYDRLEHPLINSLQKHQLIQPGMLMGIETASTGAVLNAKGNGSNWLYTIGTARKGTLWETTAVPELRIQAQELSQTLLQSVSMNENSQLVSINSSDYPFIFRQLFDRESCTYTYLIADARSRRALLVDSVLEQVERDLQVLRELDLSLHACLETHVHADHVTGADKLRTFTGCQIIVPAHSGVIGADRIIHDQEVLSLGAVQIRAFATPGHTGSHMAYWVNHSHLLTGDALLIRGCGRTDFQGGDAGMLYETVTQTLFSLPDTTLVYPGHDYQGRTVSTIGEEKQWNPRFAGRNRSQFIELMSQLNLPYPQRMKRAVPANQHCGIIEHEQEIEAQEHQPRDIQTLEAANSFIYSGMYI